MMSMIRFYIGESDVNCNEDFWTETRRLVENSGDPELVEVSTYPCDAQVVEAYCQMALRKTREFMLEFQDSSLDFDSVVRETVRKVEDVWKRSF